MPVDKLMDVGYHLGLTIAVIVLYRRTLKLERLLADCIGDLLSDMDLRDDKP